jgi:hypothetical protein
VYDAVGVRMYQLPMTPDRVLEAIERRDRAKEEHAVPAAGRREAEPVR